MRLILDDSSNGRVNLRANPGHRGDLEKYLPGYTVPHHGRPRQQAIRVNLRNGPTAQWRAENLVLFVKPQIVSVVCHVPAGVSGVVTFQLIDPSNLPGVASNLHAANIELHPLENARPDFELLHPVHGPVDEIRSVPVNTTLHEARVELLCRDFGGNCKIRAIVQLTTQPEPLIAEMEVPEFDFGARSPTALPKAWLAEIGAEITHPDNDSSRNALPGERRGDGIRDHEEYRGFWIRGRHWRLNDKDSDGPDLPSGGPFVKDLFLVDRSGLYDPSARDPKAANFPTLRLSENRFLLPYGLAVHLLHPWEMATRAPDFEGTDVTILGWPRGGPINFNGANDQCAVVLINRDLKGRSWGLTPDPAVVNVVMADGQVFSRAVAVDVNLVTRDLINLQRPWQRDDVLNFTVAHELGHRLTLEHSKALLRKRGSALAAPAGVRVFEFWAEKDSDFTTTIRWWGIVEELLVKGKQIPFPIENLPKQLGLFVLDRRPALSDDTGTISEHGETHAARIYSYLAIGSVEMIPETIIIEPHNGLLLDAIASLTDLQSDLLDHQKRFIDVKSSGPLP